MTVDQQKLIFHEVNMLLIARAKRHRFDLEPFSHAFSPEGTRLHIELLRRYAEVHPLLKSFSRGITIAEPTDTSELESFVNEYTPSLWET